MKWFWGWLLGTVISTMFLGIFTYANGTPLPPLSDWQQVAAYPTGSAMTTFEVMWIIYVASFIFVFSLAWICRKLLRRGDRPAT